MTTVVKKLFKKFFFSSYPNYDNKNGLYPSFSLQEMFCFSVNTNSILSH